jgi:hypothetical protein
MLALWADGRSLEQLRTVLFDITQDAALRSRFDPVEELRFFWHQQALERDRVFTHHLSPGHRPPLLRPEWAAQVERLKSLHSATATVA